MKKTFIALIIIAVIAVVAWSLAKGDADAPSVGGNFVEGTIVSVSNEQVMFDGPSIIVIRTETGAEETIHVPSMGINLCEAKDSIASPYDLKAGQRVSVSGSRAEGSGAIVPCESAEHFLRVI